MLPGADRVEPMQSDTACFPFAATGRPGSHPGSGSRQSDGRFCPGARRPGEQPAQRGRGRAPRRDRRLHRRLRLRQVLPRLRHHLCRGAAPLLRIRGPLRPPADPTGPQPQGGNDHRAAARRRASAAPRDAELAAPRWARSPRCPTRCACSSRAPAATRDGASPLDSDAFSPNTAAGACPECHGLGIAHTVTEASLVPDTSLSIRDGAIAAWPGAWQGKNLRDILTHLGHDVDTPWRKLPKKDRDWILFTEEQPVVEVTPQRDRVAKPYKGRFWSAKSYVLHTLADSKSTTMRERVLRFMETGPCPVCGGSRPDPGRARRHLRRAHHRRAQRRPHDRTGGASSGPPPNSPRPAPPPASSPPARATRWPSPSPATSCSASRCCWTSAWATWRWAGPRPRSPPARCNGSGSPPSSAPACSA